MTVLSDRELEVLRLVASGRQNKAIGIELGISELTVRNHVASISGKTGLSGRTNLAIYALQRGVAQLGSLDETRL